MSFGGVLDTVANFIGGREQRSAQSEWMDRQMDFQERMSSSAHQREVADLRAAGLNPILSTRHGGASSPSGTMGTAVNYIGESVSRGVSTAMQAERTEAEVENMRENAKKLIEDAQLSRDMQIRSLYERVLLREQAEKTHEESENVRTLGRILEHEETSAKAAATSDRQREEALESAPWARRLGSIIRELLPLGSAANSARSLSR